MELNLAQVEAYLEGEVNRLSLVTFSLEQVKQLRNLEAQKKSAAKDLADVKVEIEAEKSNLEKAKDLTKKEKVKLEKSLEQANEAAASIVAQAKSEANALLGKAVLDADKQKQDAFKAKADADAYVAAKSKEVEALQAKADALEQAIKAYQATLSGA